MNGVPLVSVIIPVYNVEQYLEQCLDSVIKQTLKDIEIICVDDGSTDKSLEILNKYQEKDDRVTVLTQKNLRAGVARNTGLKVARGKYLSFLDSDDFFDPHMLEDMYNKAEKDKSDIVICEFREYNTITKTSVQKARIKKRFVDKSPFSPVSVKNELFDFGGLNAWTKLFRRQLFVDNDLHFETCLCCNDMTCVCTAMAAAKRISIIPKPYVYYRTHQSNNLTAKRNQSVDSFMFAAQKLQENLVRLKLYETFKIAFVIRMKKSFRWELSLCNQQQKMEKKKKAREILSSALYTILYGEQKTQPNTQQRTFMKFGVRI